MSAAQINLEGEPTALGAWISTREWDPMTDAIQVRSRPVAELGCVDVSTLLEVRRPVSYAGMTNYIGRMPVPSRHDARAVWFESRNEQENYRDLLMTEDVAELATQPLRIE